MVGGECQARTMVVPDPLDTRRERRRRPNVIESKTIAVRTVPSVVASFGIGGTPGIYEAERFQCLVLILAIEGLTSLIDTNLPGIEVAQQDDIAISELFHIGEQP